MSVFILRLSNPSASCTKSVCKQLVLCQTKPFKLHLKTFTLRATCIISYLTKPSSKSPDSPPKSGSSPLHLKTPTPPAATWVVQSCAMAGNPKFDEDTSTSSTTALLVLTQTIASPGNSSGRPYLSSQMSMDRRGL